MTDKCIGETVRRRRKILAKKEGIEKGILDQAESNSQIKELREAVKEGNQDNIGLILQHVVSLAPEGYTTRVSIKDIESGRILHKAGQPVTSLKPGTLELNIPGKGALQLVLEASPTAGTTSSFNILWLGMQASGKSSIIERIRQGEFVSAPLTIGLNVSSFLVEGVKLVNCDISGHKSFRSIWDTLIVGKPDVIVYVIDTSDGSTLSEAKDSLLNFALKTELLQGKPILVVANKRDVEGALSIERLKSELGLPTLVKDREWKLIETSAKTGSGITDMLEWILQRIKTANGVESK